MYFDQETGYKLDPGCQYYVYEYKVGEQVVNYGTGNFTATENNVKGSVDVTDAGSSQTLSYSVTGTGNVSSGFTFTNKRSGTVDVIVNKKWKDPTGTLYSARPYIQFTVSKLKGNTTEAVATFDSSAASYTSVSVKAGENEVTSYSTLNGKTGDLTVTFGSLPKYDDNGNVISYLVSEQMKSQTTGSE